MAAGFSECGHDVSIGANSTLNQISCGARACDNAKMQTLTSLRDPVFLVVGKAFWLCQLEGFIPPRHRIVAASARGFFATFGFILAGLVRLSGQKHTNNQ